MPCTSMDPEHAPKPPELCFLGTATSGSVPCYLEKFARTPARSASGFPIGILYIRDFWRAQITIPFPDYEHPNRNTPEGMRGGGLEIVVAKFKIWKNPQRCREEKNPAAGSGGDGRFGISIYYIEIHYYWREGAAASRTGSNGTSDRKQ